MKLSINPLIHRLSIISCAMLISGCAMPLPYQIASWALDGISYIATDKIADNPIADKINFVNDLSFFK